MVACEIGKFPERKRFERILSQPGTKRNPARRFWLSPGLTPRLPASAWFSAFAEEYGREKRCGITEKCDAPVVRPQFVWSLAPAKTAAEGFRCARHYDRMRSKR